MAIKTYFPKEENLMKTEDAVRLWYEALKDIDYTTMSMALNKWVATEKWSPTIADLRRLSFEVSNPEIPTWDNAWETVLHAVRTYGYNRRIEAMDSLDEITRKTVARIGWNQICMSEQIGIERAAFRDIYNVLADKTKEQGQIAPAVKAVIEATRQAHNQLLADKLIRSKPVAEKPSEKETVELSKTTQKKLDDLRERLRGVG
jgi:hypothetical protein